MDIFNLKLAAGIGRLITVKLGMHLTQVAPTCSMGA